MKYVLILAAILVSSFFATESAFAYNSHCTATTPCTYQVCGDHICSQSDFMTYMETIQKAQKGNVTIANMTNGNMTIGQSTGSLYTGTMSYEDVASDGTIVILSTDHPTQWQHSVIGIGFFTANGKPIPNQNYAINITQKNTVVFSNSTGHAASGIDILITSPMPSSNDPLNLLVTLKGVGPSTADPATWTGVKGQTLNFAQGPLKETSVMAGNTTIVKASSASSPEFGPVASIVLAISILSVIVFAARTRTGTRL